MFTEWLILTICTSVFTLIAFKNLTDLISDLQTPAEAQELRVKFAPDCDFKTLGKKVIEEFKAYASELPYATPANDNHEGFRLRYDDVHGNGWALLRMSLHDPVLPINVESDSENGTVKIVKELYYFLKKYDFLDVSPLERSIENWRTEKIESLKEKFSTHKN